MATSRLSLMTGSNEQCFLTAGLCLHAQSKWRLQFTCMSSKLVVVPTPIYYRPRTPAFCSVIYTFSSVQLATAGASS